MRTFDIAPVQIGTGQAMIKGFTANSSLDAAAASTPIVATNRIEGACKRKKGRIIKP
jgi:hypothetical protein